MMKRMFNAGCWLLALPMLAAEPELLTEARRALAESIPEIAIRKLETLRAGPALALPERDAATLLLAEALLDAGRFSEALQTIDPLAGTDSATALLLKAHILAESGAWSSALPLYQRLSSSVDAPAAATLGLAESLNALGRTTEAIAVLGPFVKAHPQAITARLRLAGLLAEARKGEFARQILAAAKPEAPGDVLWAKFVEARLLLLDGKAPEAAAIFEQVLNANESLSANLLIAATLALTEARIAISGNEVADGVLENFISKYPASAWLELAFQRLDQVYAAEKNPPEGELQKWAATPEKSRAALARYFVARLQLRARRFDRTLVSTEAFIRNFPEHPLLAKIEIIKATVHLERRQFEQAVLVLEAAERHAKDDDLRAEIELRTGLVHFQQGEYLLAANKFENAARRSTSLREIAVYNGALASLHQRNFPHFGETYQELSALKPDSELLAELFLEEGLLQARDGDPRAVERLQLFIASFATHPRVPEARLALAEIAFRDGDEPAATRLLKVATRESRTPQTDEHSEYLAVFLEDAKTPRDDATVINLARKFLLAFPTSTLLPEIRMKLGQVYFRTGDFANAETQFATLAKESPASLYTGNALFLAGQSAMKTINPDAINRALGYFDQLVKGDGPLKLYARQQQAIVQSSQGHEAEAIKLYEIILAAQPPPEPELRYAVLCAKGNSLTILGRTEPKNLEAALEVYDELAASDAPPAWRNQALFKKAAALELLGRGQDALMTYYDVLGRSAAEDREYLWYYKAGFEAARIFEAAKEWKSAIGIYEKMAVLDGPRADEARLAAKKLRLAHFIWP